MDDPRPEPREEEPSRKVVPLRPDVPAAKQPSTPPDRVEEMRQILREAEPAPPDDDLSDARVIEDERRFKKRFGFVWPPAQRAALIRLKHERGLTDPEIRLLRWSGVLKRTPTGVTLASAVWAALWGGVILGYLALLTLAVLIATVPSILGGAPITARSVGVLGLLGVFGYLIWWLHIEPWRIERRTRPTERPDLSR